MSDTNNPSKTGSENSPAEFRRPGEVAMDVYSAGIIPFGWARSMPNNWYNYFMTNVLMLSPALSGTISLISRLLGMFAQPIAGGIMDRVQVKGHKYATWINVMVPISSVLTVIMFLNFPQLGMSTATTTILAIVLFTAAMAAGSFPNAAHTGLYATMTRDKESRIRLTTRRAMGQSATNITLGMLAMPLVALLGKGNEGNGYLYTVILFSVLGVFGYYLVTVVTKPWDPVGSSADVKKGPPPPTIGELFAAIFTNPPLATMLISDAFRWSSRMMLVGFAMYNFRYVFGSMMLMAGFMTSMNLVSFVSTIISEPVSRKFGKDAIYLWGNVFLMLTMIAALLFARNNVTVYIFIICIGHVGYGPSAAQPPAYYAECAEWMQKKSGKDSKTLVMSTSFFCSAIGSLIAATLTGYCLAAIGFTPQDPSAEVINNIFRITCIVPAGLLLLAILVFLFYKANSKRWFGDVKA